MNKITKITLLGMIFSPLSFASVSQDTWWLAHTKNNSLAQYYLADAYNPDIFTESYRCAGDEFYLDVKDRKVAGCKEKSAEKYIQWLLKSANNHYPLAQSRIGIEYIKGEKVEQNIKQGIYWLEKASGPISPDANYSVGEGTIWLRDKANFKGVGEAQYTLGVLYDDGKLVKPDYKKAVKYYEMATDSYDWGDENLAQYRLYMMYKDKLKDPQKAFYWLNKSSFKPQLKLYNPRLLLVNYYLKGGQIDGSITEQPNYVSAAKQLLLNVDNRAISDADKFNYYMLLGWFHLNGLGVEKSPTMAAHYYKEGYLLSRSSNMDAILYHNDLHKLMVNQIIIPVFKHKLDVNEAITVLEQVFTDDSSAEKRFIEEFMQQLTDKHNNRYWSNSSDEQLADLFLLAKTKGIAKGYYLHAQSLSSKLLGKKDSVLEQNTRMMAIEIINLYLKGLALAPNDAQMIYELAKIYDLILNDSNNALKYYEQASELNYAEATHRLGELYYIGEKVKQDYKKAWQLLSLSAQQGYEPAQYFLFNISAEHADANWLKQQYIEHNELFLSPILQIDGSDWLAQIVEISPSNKLNYYLLKHKYPTSPFDKKDFCEAAIAYANEGNKALQQQFISSFSFDGYHGRCSVDRDNMLNWIEQSDLPVIDKQYRSALYYKDWDTRNKQMKKLADNGHSDAAANLSYQYLYSKRKKIQGINLAKKSLQQANANAADILIRYYSDTEYGLADSYQLQKMLLIRNDLRNFYSENLYYFFSPGQTSKYVMNNMLSQSQVFKLWREIAVMYENGTEISKNLVLAYVWYGLLSEYEQPGAEQKRLMIEQQLSAEQLNEAQLKLSRHRDAYRFYPLSYK